MHPEMRSLVDVEDRLRLEYRTPLKITGETFSHLSAVAVVLKASISCVASVSSLVCYGR